MPPRFRLGLIVLGLFCLLASLLVMYANYSLHRVQPFYEAAIEVAPEVLEDASQLIESRVAALSNESAQASHWQMVFSDTEVNGWLAVALAEQYADLLSENIVDPRVAFEEGELLLGFRYLDESLDTVISLRVSVDVEESDVVSVRLLKAHAGTFLLPTAKVVEKLKQAASESDLPLKWSESGCDAVASFSLQDIFADVQERRFLDAIEIRDGEVMLSGSTTSLQAIIAKQPAMTTLR